MAAISCHIFHTPPSLFRSSFCCTHSSPPRARTKAFSAMNQQNQSGPTKFMEFPYASTPQKNLMVDLVSTLETRLDSKLLPCTLSPDVQYYENPTGSAKASMLIRSGTESSKVDFILGSWVYSELPTGGVLNITSLSAYLNSSTDAPNFLIELIHSSPTSLILMLDLPPRKDLVLHPEYLKTFYDDTKLDTQRQMLEKIAEVQPYFSSSLYIRSVVSPTAIMVRIEASGPERMEEIVQSSLHPIAKDILGMWLDQCASAERNVGEADRAYLEKRDKVNRTKTIEIDLASSFPRLFGPEVANRVLEAIREVFKA